MHTVEMYKTYLWGNYELLQQKARKQCANMPLFLHVQWEQTIVPHFSAGLFSGEADTDCECLTRLSGLFITLLHRIYIIIKIM